MIQKDYRKVTGSLHKQDRKAGVDNVMGRTGQRKIVIKQNAGKELEYMDMVRLPN